MGIKVIATRQGYYGHFREPGDEFDIEDEQAFHDSWMERVDGRNAGRKVAPKQPTPPIGNAPGLAPHQKLTPQGGSDLA